MGRIRKRTEEEQQATREFVRRQISAYMRESGPDTGAPKPPKKQNSS
jgi:hypothetical protein